MLLGEGDLEQGEEEAMKAWQQMAPLLSDENSCQGSMGKQRRPRPINLHASTEAAGYWGPRHSALDPWLRLEAKSERALGPGATVGVLGTGVPGLACLRPMAWLHQRPYAAHARGFAGRPVRPIFINKESRPSRGARPHKADDTRPPQEQPH